MVPPPPGNRLPGRLEEMSQGGGKARGAGEVLESQNQSENFGFNSECEIRIPWRGSVWGAGVQKSS